MTVKLIPPHGVSVILRKVRNKPRTTQGDLVNDLQRAGTAVSLVTHYTIMVLNPAEHTSLLKPAHVQAQRPSG